MTLVLASMVLAYTIILPNEFRLFTTVNKQEKIAFYSSPLNLQKLSWQKQTDFWDDIIDRNFLEKWFTWNPAFQI